MDGTPWGRRARWVTMASDSPACRGYETAGLQGLLVREDMHTDTVLVRLEQAMGNVEGWFARRLVQGLGEARLLEITLDYRGPYGESTERVYHDLWTGTTHPVDAWNEGGRR